ncbi:MAG: family transposase [Proteobacteria bacterium]|nr:family transposase [Pseudomonadota bacterium]
MRSSVSCARRAYWLFHAVPTTRPRTVITAFTAIPICSRRGRSNVVQRAPSKCGSPTPTQGACAYLSLITDMWSRRIVGYHVHDTLQTHQVSQALKMALKTRQTRQALIHHSDRGIQYCSDAYQQLHRRHGITCSMTDGYDCYQNALAERVNGILKNEFLLHRPADIEQARRMVSESVKIYNQQRPHLSLKMKTPDEVQRASIARINQSENLRSQVST